MQAKLGLFYQQRWYSLLLKQCSHMASGLGATLTLYLLCCVKVDRYIWPEHLASLLWVIAAQPVEQLHVQVFPCCKPANHCIRSRHTFTLDFAALVSWILRIAWSS